MALTHRYPFHRILVDHLFQGTTKVWWELHEDFADAGPYTFTLQFSPTGTEDGDDWEDVTQVIDAYYAEDTVPRHTGVGVTGSYRLLLSTPTGKCYRSEPVPMLGQLDLRQWHQAREILRKERLRLAQWAGREGWLLKRKTSGERCTRCRDPLTGEVTNSNCPKCFGTGFVGGYHPPVPLRAQFGPQQVQEEPRRGRPPGPSREEPNQIRVTAFPLLGAYDVWVDATDDRRWVVRQFAHTAIIRGLPLVTQARVALLPASDLAYKVPVPGASPTDYVPYRPEIDDDNVVYVDHNFGGDDALSYWDSCDRGIVGATVKAYKKSDYDAGNTSDQYVQAQTTTTADGRFLQALPLCQGVQYVLVYEKPGQFGPDTVEVTP